MGRPDKLDDDVANHIVNDIRDGMPMRWAAIRAGVSDRTLHRWMEVGEAAEGAEEGDEHPEAQKYRQFRQRVLLARGALLSEALEVKRQHLKHEDPKVSGPASTFVLTQMFSSEFSTKTQVEATGKDGAPIVVEHSGQVEHTAEVGLSWEKLGELSLEQLEALGRGLAEVVKP